MIGKYGGPI